MKELLFEIDQEKFEIVSKGEHLQYPIIATHNEHNQRSREILKQDKTPKKNKASNMKIKYNKVKKLTHTFE